MKERHSPTGKLRREKIIKYLYTYYRQQGYYPSIREIGEATGISSTSVTNYYIDRLSERGYIARIPHISRGVTLTKEGKIQACILLGIDLQNVCPHCGEPLTVKLSSTNRTGAKRERMLSVAG